MACLPLSVLSHDLQLELINSIYTQPVGTNAQSGDATPAKSLAPQAVEISLLSSARGSSVRMFARGAWLKQTDSMPTEAVKD